MKPDRLFGRTGVSIVGVHLILAAATLPLLFDSARGGWQGFGTNVDYGTGTFPVSVAIGDLSEDGKPDLVVANEHSETISALSGHGDGTFGAKADYGTGVYPSSVAIGDLSGDGKPDLAVANFISGTVSVLLGTGGGTFMPSVGYPAGSGPTAVAIGDVNGDGKPDLAVANYVYYGTVDIFLGNGGGTFIWYADYGAGSFPTSVAIGDVSGDGNPDLAVPNGDSTVSILLGNGNGTFVAKVDYVTGSIFYSDPYFVAIGDVDGDAKPDLAVTNRGSNTVSVLLGNGDGTFGAYVEYETGDSPRSLVIGDVSGDGRPDLAVANEGSSTVSILLGHGDGTFGPKSDYGTGRNPVSVAVGDVNGDGEPDLAVANEFSNTVSVLLNLGPGIPTSISAVLQDVRAEVGVVRLRWTVPNARSTLCTVQRRRMVTDWENLGPGDAETGSSVRYEDRSVMPGERYAYRLFAHSASDQGYSDEAWILVPSDAGAPLALRLDPIYPNPFQSQTRLHFAVPGTGAVRLAIFDVGGRHVVTVLDQTLPAGWRSIAWDGRDRSGRPVPSGTYFARLEHGDKVQARKVGVAR